MLQPRRLRLPQLATKQSVGKSSSSRANSSRLDGMSFSGNFVRLGRGPYLLVR